MTMLEQVRSVATPAVAGDEPSLTGPAGGGGPARRERPALASWPPFPVLRPDEPFDLSTLLAVLMAMDNAYPTVVELGCVLEPYGLESGLVESLLAEGADSASGPMLLLARDPVFGWHVCLTPLAAERYQVELFGEPVPRWRSRLKRLPPDVVEHPENEIGKPPLWWEVQAADQPSDRILYTADEPPAQRILLGLRETWPLPEMLTLDGQKNLKASCPVCGAGQRLYDLSGRLNVHTYCLVCDRSGYDPQIEQYWSNHKPPASERRRYQPGRLKGGHR